MNLIRVMPAKGSGLLGTGGSEHDEWSQAAFPQYGEAAFFVFLHAGNCMEIAIRINGRDERLKVCTLADLVLDKGLAAGSLVVEHNGRIVKQDDWPGLELRPGDVLEMLNFVGGG